MTLRLHVPQGDLASAFTQLDAPPERIFVQEAGRAKLLPACCGTYAFYEGAGRLLYIATSDPRRRAVITNHRLHLDVVGSAVREAVHNPSTQSCTSSSAVTGGHWD
jgi:hypothetical protein